VVECTALEMRHTGNRIVGSNPTLSAIAFNTRFPRSLAPPESLLASRGFLQRRSGCAGYRAVSTVPAFLS